VVLGAFSEPVRGAKNGKIEVSVVTVWLLWYNPPVRGLFAQNETNLSTKSAPKKARSRFHEPDVNNRRTESAEFTAAKGPLEAHSITHMNGAQDAASARKANTVFWF